MMGDQTMLVYSSIGRVIVLYVLIAFLWFYPNVLL